jgi:hypothetical protein
MVYVKNDKIWYKHKPFRDTFFVFLQRLQKILFFMKICMSKVECGGIHAYIISKKN